MKFYYATASKKLFPNWVVGLHAGYAMATKVRAGYVLKLSDFLHDGIVTSTLYSKGPHRKLF